MNGTMLSPHLERKAFARGRNFVRISDLNEVDPPFLEESFENDMTSVTVPVVNQWSVHIAQVLCANLSATLMMIVHDCKCVLTGSLLCTHFRNEEWPDFFFDKCKICET